MLEKISYMEHLCNLWWVNRSAIVVDVEFLSNGASGAGRPAHYSVIFWSSPSKLLANQDLSTETYRYIKARIYAPRCCAIRGKFTILSVLPTMKLYRITTVTPPQACKLTGCRLSQAVLASIESKGSRPISLWLLSTPLSVAWAWCWSGSSGLKVFCPA